jgi:5-methylcytosine-specific restriction endonuclease McrA
VNVPSLALVKGCKGCGAELPNTPEFFYRDRGRSDGLQAKCKPCKNGYFQTWLEPRREEVYEQNNRRNRKRYADTEYREKTLAYHKARARTPEGRADKKARKAKRAALQRQASGAHTAAEILQMVEDQGGLCAYCEVPLDGVYSVDHMIPLSRGGGNDWSNLAITCPPCNMRKHTRTAEEFLASSA